MSRHRQGASSSCTTLPLPHRLRWIFTCLHLRPLRRIPTQLRQQLFGRLLEPRNTSNPHLGHLRLHPLIPTMQLTQLHLALVTPILGGGPKTFTSPHTSMTLRFSNMSLPDWHLSSKNHIQKLVFNPMRCINATFPGGGISFGACLSISWREKHRGWQKSRTGSGHHCWTLTSTGRQYLGLTRFS